MTAILSTASAVTTPAGDVLTGFHLELEITRRCQLTCPALCYAFAGPTGATGKMAVADWVHVMDDAKAAGAELVQLIGGEPTTHPDFPLLLGHAIEVGLTVEVFSNLFHIRPHMWELLAHPQVRLATSYHSDQPDQHDRVTARAGSHTRTRANIVKAVELGIPLRAGVIEVFDGQRVTEARDELLGLGVQDVGTDHARGIGKAAPTRNDSTYDTAELCGRCGRGRAAISSDGEVWPCVLGRWLSAGNVRDEGLVEVLTGPAWRQVCAQIPAPSAVCNPECKPSTGDGSDCAPAETETCGPSFCEPDSK